MAKYALTIGINRYEKPGSDLAGCVPDALDWQAALHERGFETTRLLDSEATGYNIRTHMASTLARARYRDTVVLTFSGHGTWVPDRDGDEADRRDEALCPYDLWTNGPILDDELYRLFQARRFGVRLVFISDSCHSGTVHRLAAQCGTGTPRFLPPATFLSEPETKRAISVQHAPPKGFPRLGALLLAGCRDTEYSYDASFLGRPNGAFTRAALDCLDVEPKNYRQWMAAIHYRLPSEDYPQTPQLQGSRSQQRWRVL